MHAEVGDEIVVRGRHVGDEDRKGVITEVHGEGGAPPYLVRWENGHQSVVMPSSDSLVERHPAPRASAERCGGEGHHSRGRGTRRISRIRLMQDRAAAGHGHCLDL